MVYGQLFSQGTNAKIGDIWKDPDKYSCEKNSGKVWKV